MMRGREWLRAGLAGGAALAVAAAASIAGCGSGASAVVEQSTGALSETSEQTGNVSDSAEVAGLMRGRGAAIDEAAAEGFRCDAAPLISYATVCGTDLPATVHLSWINCQAPDRQHGAACLPAGADGGVAADADAGVALADGGFAALPPCDQDGDGDGDSDGPGEHGGGGHHHPFGRGGPGVSSGTVDITNTYAPPTGCTGAIAVTQAVTFTVDRTRPDGQVFSLAGSTNSTLQLPAAGTPPSSKSTTMDVTRTTKAASSTAVGSVHVTGTRTVAYSSDTPPTRTVSEDLSAAFSDGTSEQATATDVIYPPMSVCPWPTSGTVKGTLKDGSTHQLVYGPSCGTATLDGNAIELQRPGGRGGRGGRNH